MISSLAAWLARVAGVGHEMASRIDRAEFHWSRPAVLLAGIVLLPAAAWWISKRHRERMPWLSSRQRMALDACRTAVLGLLFLVLAGPSLRLEEQVRQPPVLAIITDVSDSMTLPVGRLPASSIPAVAAAAGLPAVPAGDESARDAAGDTIARLSRSELVDRVLATHDKTTLPQLRERLDVRRYEVARAPRRLPADPVSPHDSHSITRSRTRSPSPAARMTETYDTAIGASLEMAMDDAADRAIAGIVLLSDGRSTTGIDPLEAIRRASEAAGGTPRGPVFAVPVGSPDPPVDIAVTDLLAAPEATVDDTITIAATLSTSGFAGRDVPVELRDAAGVVLDSQTITLREGRQTAVFSWSSDRVGTHVLTVAVPTQENEIVQGNNVAETSVDVSNRRLKVLVIDHAPRWDLRFLDHAIRRDAAFTPTVLITASAEDPTGTAPGDEGSSIPNDAAGWASYDLVFLGDVPATVLDAGRQASLVEAVMSHGVGLVLQPGVDHLPRDYTGSPLATLFPVVVDAATGDGAAIVSAADYKPLKMLVTARGAMHPSFALGGDAARNRRRWSDMPPFFLAAAATSPTPAATVLAEVQAPGSREARPLVVEAPAGTGRVLWIGTDETFRWRRNVGDQLFWRFWGQSLRSVARRPDRPADSTWLAVSPARCEPGSPVLIQLSLVDGERKPVVSASQEVTVTGPSGGLVTLHPGGRPGLYAGTFIPEAAGGHAVGSAAHPDATGEIVVAEPSRERAQPGVDRGALEAIADVSGGALVELGDFASLPQRLADTSVETKMTYEDDLWDTWPVLVLLVGLFCVDVGIRRLSGSS